MEYNTAEMLLMRGNRKLRGRYRRILRLWGIGEGVPRRRPRLVSSPKIPFTTAVSYLGDGKILGWDRYDVDSDGEGNGHLRRCSINQCYEERAGKLAY